MTGNRPAGLRNPGAIYATGLLGMGYTDLYIFLIPLYGLSLGMSAGEIGVLVGGRHLLALFLSIPVGTFMDRFGFFARIGTTLAPLILGVVWDFGGAWPSYLIGIVWGVLLTLALLRAPEAEIAPVDGRGARSSARFRLRDTVPRLSDYIACFA